jgi:hypothetical protein
MPRGPQRIDWHAMERCSRPNARCVLESLSSSQFRINPIPSRSNGYSPRLPPKKSVAEPAPSNEALAPVAVVIPKGSVLRVRIDKALDTRHNRAGDQFHASLSAPVLVHGRMVLPRGTEFTGHITQSDASGRLKGRAVIAVTLDSFRLNGKEYRVHTGSVARRSAADKKRNLGFIGGGTGLGAALGAIAGGGKGALIGAAAAGTAGAAATGQLEVGIGAESLLTFPLRTEVELL